MRCFPKELIGFLSVEFRRCGDARIHKRSESELICLIFVLIRILQSGWAEFRPPLSEYISEFVQVLAACFSLLTELLIWPAGGTHSYCWDPWGPHWCENGCMVNNSAPLRTFMQRPKMFPDFMQPKLRIKHVNLLHPIIFMHDGRMVIWNTKCYAGH